MIPSRRHLLDHVCVGFAERVRPFALRVVACVAVDFHCLIRYVTAYSLDDHIGRATLGQHTQSMVPAIVDGSSAHHLCGLVVGVTVHRCEFPQRS